MKYIDLHCDTASKLLYNNVKLKQNNEKVDIEKLKKGNAMAQVFAHFIELEFTEDPYVEFIKMYTNFMNEVENNKNNIEIVKNIDQLEEINNKGKLGAFISIEEGEVVGDSIEKLQNVYDLGVRLITLTWNFKNKIGYPNYKYQYQNEGLTVKGKEMVEAMEYLGVIPDCSHLSDGGFYDLIDICKKPFIATHSNSRSICSHPRNLTDDMINALGNKGGILGINFCSAFVGEKKITAIEDLVRHIKHIKNVGGIDVIGLGTDFDGIENEVEISDASQMGILAEALLKNKFTIDEIEKIFYKNSLRVFKETLK